MIGVLVVAKAGRKRKTGKRTASGQLSRATSAYAENLVPIATRMRLYDLNEKDARDQRAGTVVGRMRMAGHLTEPEYLAAQNYLGLYNAFKSAVKAPDAMKDGQGGGAGGDVVSPDYVDWCVDVRASFREAERVVLRAGERNRRLNTVAAIDYLLCRDHPLAHLEPDLQAALAALAVHFGLVKAMRAEPERA